MDQEKSNAPIIISYFPFRGKAQLIRLLCQFLHIEYKDRFFDPDEWKHFQQNQAKDWVLKDLPVLEDGDFRVTTCSGIIFYLLEKAGRMDLMGKNLQDKTRIDCLRSKFDLRDTILGVMCVNRSNCKEENKKCLQSIWYEKIFPMLKDHESRCVENSWYFGYISVLDFVIYQIMSLFQKFFENERSKFKKLFQLKEKVSLIPQIINYEQSQRSVKQFCPVRYFSKFKQEKIKKSLGSSSASSTSKSSKHQMDLQ